MALWKYLKPKPTKDGLPDPNGSLSAKVPSQAIAQANREVRKLLYKQDQKKDKKQGPYNRFAKIRCIKITFWF